MSSGIGNTAIMPGGKFPRKRGRPSKAMRLARLFQPQVGRPRKIVPKDLASNAESSATIDSGSNETVDFGRETDRWKRFKVQHDVDSNEDMAKMLLDMWDLKRNNISVGPATIRDFQNFQSRTSRSADELIRFFLRLDVEPGQNMLVFAEHITKMFESLKTKLLLNSNDLMKYLFDTYEKYLNYQNRDDPTVLNLDKSVRRAVREELIQLVHEGILPAAGPSLSNSLHGVSTYSDNMDNNAVQPDTGGYVMNGHAESPASSSKHSKVVEQSPDSAKKRSRSRKSLPQRVMMKPDVKVEEPPLGSVMDNSLGGQGFQQSSIMITPSENDVIMVDDVDVMQYNYVINTGTPSVNNPITRALLMPPKPSEPSSTMTSSILFSAPLPSSQQMDLPSVSDKDLEAQGIFKLGQFSITRDQESQLNCPFCEYKSPMIARLRRHFTLHTGKAFNCSKCDRSYTEEYKLKEHFQVKHVRNVHFKCEQCDRDFTSKGGLRYHMKTMHRKDFEFWCEKCCKGFKQSLFYDWHMKKHNDPQQFKCNVCMKEFSYLATLSMHKKTCIAMSGDPAVNTLACEMCGDDFGSAKLLEEHISSEHCDVSRYRCTCGQEFRWRGAYDNHRLVCGQDKSPQAIQAVSEGNKDGLENVAIINVESLYKEATPKPLVFDEGTNVDFEDSSIMDSIQVTNILSGEQFTCDLTGDADDDTPVSTESIPITSTPIQGVSPDMHACQLCDYKSPKLSHLRRHILTHTGKKWRCNECPKSFNDKYKLQSHQSSKHQGRARYKCDKCSRTFSSKGGIMYHQQTKHNNSYKYKCETCDKGFNTIQHYIGHKNTHSGVRPYICEKCNLGFAYPSVLTSHKRVCKGKIEGMENGQLDLYPCKQCKEKFAMLSSLEEHVKEKHGMDTGNRYFCDCGAEFELRALYDLHKSNCVGDSRSLEIIQMNMSKDADELEMVAQQQMEVGAEGAEFQQLSQEKFDAIVSNQPVFPS